LNNIDVNENYRKISQSLHEGFTFALENLIKADAWVGSPTESSGSINNLN